MVIAPKLDTSCSEHAISHIETNVYNLLQYAVFEKHGKLIGKYTSFLGLDIILMRKVYQIFPSFFVFILSVMVKALK